MSKQLDSDSAIEQLAALANGCRLEIFRRLVARYPQGMAAGEIGEALDCPASTLSFHLAHLTRAGLIEQRREGRSIIYSVSMDRIAGLMGFLVDDCCAGRPEICAPLGRPSDHRASETAS